MLAPPFPMMFLWNCLKMGTESEKLFSIYERIKVAVTSKVEEQKKKCNYKDGEPHQFGNDFLEKLGTFLHLILRPS